jgi:hypothetical protein
MEAGLNSFRFEIINFGKKRIGKRAQRHAQVQQFTPDRAWTDFSLFHMVNCVAILRTPNPDFSYSDFSIAAALL